MGWARSWLRAVDRESEDPQANARARAILDEGRTLETFVRRFTDFVKLEAAASS